MACINVFDHRSRTRFLRWRQPGKSHSPHSVAILRTTRSTSPQNEAIRLPTCCRAKTPWQDGDATGATGACDRTGAGHLLPPLAAVDPLRGKRPTGRERWLFCAAPPLKDRSDGFSARGSVGNGGAIEFLRQLDPPRRASGIPRVGSAPPRGCYRGPLRADPSHGDTTAPSNAGSRVTDTPRSFRAGPSTPSRHALFTPDPPKITPFGHSTSLLPSPK